MAEIIGLSIRGKEKQVGEIRRDERELLGELFVSYQTGSNNLYSKCIDLECIDGTYQ